MLRGIFVMCDYDAHRDGEDSNYSTGEESDYSTGEESKEKNKCQQCKKTNVSLTSFVSCTGKTICVKCFLDADKKIH